MQRLAALCSVATTLCAAALFYTSTASTAAATHTVVIDGVKFDPETITVKVGDTVVWVNKDPFPHTVSSQVGGFDSCDITAGQSWSYKATRAGEFPYICVFHPTMKATLRVE